MPNRKKTMMLMASMPHEVHKRLEELAKAEKAECLSDIIIKAVDAYYDTHTKTEESATK